MRMRKYILNMFFSNIFYSNCFLLDRKLFGCKLSVVIIMLFCLPLISDAKHIIGGDMSYTCISQTADEVSLSFELILYRDQTDKLGAPCDDDATFGIWQGQEGNWNYVGQTSPRGPVDSPLHDILNPPCADAGSETIANIPPNEECIYKFNIDLPKISENYLITYQRCCRNLNISNVVEPDHFGAVFSIELTPAALAVCNNSPKFTVYNTAIFCANRTLMIDNFAPDIDNDSVGYSFCIPISAGGRDDVNENRCDYVKPNPEYCGPEEFQNVQFITPPYSFNQPLIGDPNLELNSETGMLQGRPTINGAYVMAICAEEYRNGVLFTKIRRDLQVLITDCTPKDAKLSVSPEDEPFVLNTGPDGTLPGDPDKPLDDVFIVRVCGQTSVKFDLNNASTPYETESFKWFFDLGDKTIESDDRAPRIDFPGIGVYTGFMIIDPDSPPCSDTANVEVTILPTVESQFEIEFDACRAGDIEFTDKSTTLPKEADNSIVNWEWDFGDGNVSNLREPTHFYTTPGVKSITLTVFDDNGCSNSQLQTIEWFPVPEPRVGPDGFLGCSPQTFLFDNLSTPIDSNYEVEWNFGDNSVGPERFDISPSHTYEEPGVYDIQLTIISPRAGCEETKKFRELIEVIQGFETNFNMNPDEPRLIGERIAFTNTSDIGAQSFVWDFGGRGVSFEENPSFVVSDTGHHVISLQTTWDNGCSSIFSREFDIIPCIEVKFPNAFTPNGDGRNEVFKGVVYGLVAKDFKLSIYDRWGKLLFETNNPDLGWNGKYLNDGENLPSGVYMYKVGFSNPSCDIKPSPGFATLLR